MVHTLSFFSSKYSLFHNSNIFGSCIIHSLYTGCAKIKKNNSGAKRLISLGYDNLSVDVYLKTLLRSWLSAKLGVSQTSPSCCTPQTERAASS